MIAKRPPLVSVITTTYNKFQYLFETLDSIFKQDYSNIELIIGDDGSKYFPKEEIVSYIADHKRNNIVNTIILHEEQNHGTVWNCDNCRRHANGTYLMGIASDDRFIDERVISEVVEFFQNTGASIVTCRRQFVDNLTDKKMALLPFKRQVRWMKFYSNLVIFQKLSSFCFLTGANTYYTKEFFIEMGGFDLSYKYMEDYPFFLKILRTNTQIHMLDRVTILYRYGSGISTISHKKNKFRKELYDDRIRYMEKDIIPYMQDFPWWRKEQMRVRLRRFIMEREGNSNNSFIVYIKLFLFSPIGTLVQLWYQISYKFGVSFFKK